MGVLIGREGGYGEGVTLISSSDKAWTMSLAVPPTPIMPSVIQFSQLLFLADRSASVLELACEWKL